MKKLALLASHCLVGALGFAAGVYFLPIVIAPPSPSGAELAQAAGGGEFSAQFRKDLKGSDFLHWGEGRVTLGRKTVAFSGRLAPGPDYKLYLAPEFVDTKEEFLRIKARSLKVGEVKTFEGFIVPLADTVDVTRYNSVVVWCERFSMFITAAKYR